METETKTKAVSVTYRKRRACISRLLTKVLSVYGISQKELAKQLGVHPTMISSWSNGNSAPNGRLEFERIKREAKFLLDNIPTPIVEKQTKKEALADWQARMAQKGVAQDVVKEVIGGGRQVSFEDLHMTPGPITITPTAIPPVPIAVTPTTISPAQYIEANGLGFFESRVVKRITRHNKPTGEGREDILKAIRELNMLLDIYSEGELI